MGAARQREAKEKLGRQAARSRPSPRARPLESREPAADGLLQLQRAVGNRGVLRAVVQRQLQVGPAGDEFEREADEMADQAMRTMAAGPVAGQEWSRVMRSTVDGVVGLEGGPLAEDTEAAIGRERGRGDRLPEPVRTSMEGSFGADFSSVRVHAGPSADALNRSMQARAFTVGNDIFFAEGQYDPRTTSGQRLLAHELAHTVQQGAAPAAPARTARRRLAIDNPPFAGQYDGRNMRTLLDGVATVIYEPVKRGPLPFIHAKGLYSSTDVHELAAYMTGDDASKPRMDMTVTYGADHGDYHFTGKVTKKKAQWTLAKGAAQNLMTTAINTHMAALLAGTAEAGWTSWYIGVFHGAKVGDTIEGPVNNFTIQLQVSKEFNTISYHGYPDQRLKKAGVGKSKSSIE